MGVRAGVGARRRGAGGRARGAAGSCRNHARGEGQRRGPRGDEAAGNPRRDPRDLAARPGADRQGIRLAQRRPPGSWSTKARSPSTTRSASTSSAFRTATRSRSASWARCAGAWSATPPVKSGRSSSSPTPSTLDPAGAPLLQLRPAAAVPAERRRQLLEHQFRPARAAGRKGERRKARRLLRAAHPPAETGIRPGAGRRGR